MTHGFDTVAVEVSSHEEHGKARARFEKSLKAEDTLSPAPQILAELFTSSLTRAGSRRLRSTGCRNNQRTTPHAAISARAFRRRGSLMRNQSKVS